MGHGKSKSKTLNADDNKYTKVFNDSGKELADKLLQDALSGEKSSIDSKLMRKLKKQGIDLKISTKIFHNLNDIDNPKEIKELSQLLNKSLKFVGLLNGLFVQNGNKGIQRLEVLPIVNKNKDVKGSYTYGLSRMRLSSYPLYSVATRGKSKGSGWSTSSYNPNYTAIHEFGHHIDSSLNLSSSVGKGKKAVSEYGNKNEKEAFAEAFVHYCLGTKPVNGKAYYKEFCSTMKSNGLGYFKGCIK